MGSVFTRMQAVCRLWYQRYRTRFELAALDARALDDIGIGRDERRRETARWFWQA